MQSRISTCYLDLVLEYVVGSPQPYQLHGFCSKHLSCPALPPGTRKYNLLSQQTSTPSPSPPPPQPPMCPYTVIVPPSIGNHLAELCGTSRWVHPQIAGVPAAPRTPAAEESPPPVAVAPGPATPALPAPTLPSKGVSRPESPASGAARTASSRGGCPVRGVVGHLPRCARGR